MSDGITTLNGWIASLHSLDQLANETALEAAPLVEAVQKKSAAGGVAPDGTKWADRKEGGRAYANAADKVTAKALGPIVKITLTGPEVFGQFGARGPRRATIPSANDEIPAAVSEAMLEGGRRAFARLMGGAK